ncbi:MAG: MBL fold metallo-hydrolase [Xanthomonadales bacterium]|nr:MBL fold metallo-hydrolase [Gammaproteobacteria bacterium]MBT8073389.1 MBL fold metallo-hydrolase [Gammaproteobacteria bacterium]NNK04233.1 MBL fold metallo-hydrolase [Xanthomonadales bacterium]
MAARLQFFGAAGEVTGSCHMITVGGQRLLLDCGMIQGGRKDEARNRNPFPFDPGAIDAVILSHAHIDHSGRLPLLVKSGFRGPIFTHKACRDLCRVMLKDAGYLSEKDAEWENRKRARKGLKPVEPLFTVQDAEFAMRQFRPLVYRDKQQILPGVTLRLSDAGHILGSSIVELWLQDDNESRKLVFSGDLGRSGMPVLEDPEQIRHADRVIMESTYGDRLHQSWDETYDEMHTVLNEATGSRGNILIPSFAVGRTQEILFLFAKYHKEWGLDRWQIFLDSPMAIEATRIFMQNTDLFDAEAAELWRQNSKTPLLPNLNISETPEQSMAINRIQRGALIIAASGMCTGGRIRHHLKHNLWRSDCQIIFTGFQARGTPGRAIVDGAKHIHLWGEKIRVAARVHTIGGLSAHADQDALKSWYSNFAGHPPVSLVHGEERAMMGLSTCLQRELSAPVHIAHRGEVLEL